MNDTGDRSITLTLTGSCNLRCTYCYECNKNSKHLSFELARDILKSELDKIDDKIIYIELFGGEPFLEFDLITKIYDYLDTYYKAKNWIIFVTTNGTLIHAEVQEWLKKHKKLICGLSIDGTKQMQDLNRSDSFDLIDLNFFLQTYPNQSVKMTISKETLPMLSEGVIYLHKLGFGINCNLAFGIDWSSEENKIILERELKKLIDFYIANPNIKPCSMLNFPIEHLGFERKTNKIKKWCGTGTHMKTFYVNGEAYPCQFFMPLSDTNRKPIKYGELNVEDEIPIERFDKKCQTCPILEACPTCFGSNYMATGNIYSKDPNLCELTKIIIKARSYFRALQWEKGQLHLTKVREQALLRSIKLIQENL